MDWRLLQADELGVRLEIVGGLPLWEPHKDMIVFNPCTLLVLHIRKDNVTRQISPVTINLECGCCCTV